MVKIIIPFLLLTLMACGPQVKFVQPQPRGGKNLFRIPQEFCGEYIDISDSSHLKVDSVSVVAIWNSTEILPKDSIAIIEKDLELSIKRDTQIYVSEKRGNWLSNGVNIDVKFIDDSVIINAIAENRIFEISDSQIVRKYRGYCLLNTKTPEGLWLIKVLQVKNGNLTFGDLLDAEQVKKMKRVTRVAGPIDSLKNEPLEYYLNPTRRELRRILRSRSNCDIYVGTK